MGHLVSVTGSDAKYIKKLIVVIAQTECNAVEAVLVTTVEIVVLHSMIEVTAGEPETAVSIAVDGLSEDVRGATKLTLVEVAVANVVVTAEIVVRVVTTTAAVQFFLVETIGTKNVEVAESSMIRWIMDIGWRRHLVGFAGSLVGSAANLEHPLSDRFGWTETDLKENVLELEADDLDEKIMNDGVEAKRFKVRAWGGVHMSQSGQENPGAQCGDKDSDIRRIDDEECVVKDWRHTHREAMSSKEETGMDAIRREDEAMGCSMR